MRFIDKKGLIFLFLLTFVIMLFYSPTLVYVNTTPSIATGFYLRIPATTIRRGDIVCYVPPEDVLKEVMKYSTKCPPKYFIKRVGALENDSYEIENETGIFKIENKYIGIARDTTQSGQPLPKHKGKHIVNKDEFLPIALNPYSFDGRYTGTIPLSCIVSKAIPIFTF